MDEEAFTVGDLRRHLQRLGDDHKLSFAGGLTFYRLKRWADDEHIIEFNEAQGYLSDAFKMRNPHVQVVFIGSENVDRDKSGVIGSQNVEVR